MQERCCRLVVRLVFKFTDLNQIWSLQYITKPAITNAGTYTYTGGNVGPTIANSSFYTVTGNKKSAVSSSAYTFRVSLNDKTAYRWSDGSTADITGTYYIKYATHVLTVKYRESDMSFYSDITYVNELGETKSYRASDGETERTLYVKQGSAVSYAAYYVNNKDDPTYIIWLSEPGVDGSRCLGVGSGTFTVKTGSFTAKQGTLDIYTYVPRSNCDEKTVSYNISLP